MRSLPYTWCCTSFIVPACTFANCTDAICHFAELHLS